MIRGLFSLNQELKKNFQMNHCFSSLLVTIPHSCSLFILISYSILLWPEKNGFNELCFLWLILKFLFNSNTLHNCKYSLGAKNWGMRKSVHSCLRHVTCVNHTLHILAYFAYFGWFDLNLVDLICVVIWASSGSWWWTGKPGVLSPWGCKESDMTEQLNWTDLYFSESCVSICNQGFVHFSFV